jgi:hypothetical protein
MSTLRVNTIQNSGGTGSPAINGLAAAWVNFNGTGTVAIRASSNVSSITDRGTGAYTVNFTNSMPDTNFAAVLGHRANSAASPTCWANITVSSGVFIDATQNNGTGTDPEQVSVAIFR